MNSRDTTTAGTRRVGALYAATRELLTAPDRESLCSVTVRTAVDILDLPLVGVHLGDSEGNLKPVATTPAVSRGDEIPEYARGSTVWEVYRTGEPILPGDGPPDENLAAGLAIPIDDHGVLVAGTTDEHTIDTASVELVRLLAENTAVALDRLDHERRLDRLHKAARKLLTARDTAAVAAAATNAAHEILGLRVNAVLLRSSDSDRLVPVSVTEEAKAMFGDIPDLDADSVAWRAYERGEAEIHADIRRDDRAQNSDTPARSELILPLGDHGVFIAGTDEKDAFDESYLSLARVFTDNVEAGLDRAEREATLRVRETELERQNERLEEFASVVSHDLRNPLNVAQGRLELAMDDCDNEHLDHVAEAHGRMATLIEDLLALARHGQSVGEVESVALTPLAREVWTGVSGGTLEIHGELGTVEADVSRLRELFENLFRNAVDHVGEEVTVEVGPLTDDGGPDADESGFYVADDGPGILPENREEVFERGYTTADQGTGFGLPIVREIAEAHGWRVSVTGDDGGARFEVRTDPE